MTTYVESTHMTALHCAKCEVLFGMPTEMEKRRRNDKKSFFCPDGHSNYFPGATEAERLKQELDRQREMNDAEAARRITAEQQRDEIDRAHRRMRARVMNGVCPCCNRTFQNLLRHMTTEHVGELDLKALRTAFGMTQTVLAREIDVSPTQISAHENGRGVSRGAEGRIKRWVESVKKATH